MTTFYRSKLESLIEEYEQIASDLKPIDEGEWDTSEFYDMGKARGIEEVLDELRKIIDGVR